MYRDLVYRPGVDTVEVETLPYRPGSDTSFAEILPYKPRTHTPLNPAYGSPYDIESPKPVPMQPKMTMEIDLLEKARQRFGGSGGGIVEDKPNYPGIDERMKTYEPGFGPDFMNKIDQADRLARMFLDMYLPKVSEIAGYRPFTPVDPSDVDPGGPESPETLERFAEYLNRRRQRGDFERARQRLMQQGFPVGGV
jgi:hypothetical protein